MKVSEPSAEPINLCLNGATHLSPPCADHRPPCATCALVDLPGSWNFGQVHIYHGLRNIFLYFQSHFQSKTPNIFQMGGFDTLCPLK